MTNLKYLADNVVNVIKETEDYKQYLQYLALLKEDPKLYLRTCEFRQKNRQIREDNSGNAFDRMEALTNEFEDVITNETAVMFISKETALCKMVHDFYYAITGELEIDI